MFAPFVARLSLVGAIFLTSSSLYAARLAVLSPKVDSDSPVSEGRRNKFHDSLAQGLVDSAGSGWTVLSAEEVRQRLAGRDDLLSCQQGACIGQVAAQLQVDRVVVPKIAMKSAVGGSAYQIILTAMDPNGKHSNVIFSERCGDDNEGCNLSRAFDAMRKTAAALVPKLTIAAPPQPVETPRPVSEPPVPTPNAEMTLKDPGSAATSPSSAISLSNPNPNSPPTPAPRHIGYRVGWIASGILAGGMLITSIPFLILSPRDGQPTCTDRPSNQCPTRYEGNLATGLGLLGGGLAAATAFGVLYYLDRRDLKRSTGQVAVFPMVLEQGSGLSAIARF